MLTLPPRFAAVILTFAALFHHRTWAHAQALLVGAILAPGVRTVTSVLRVLGRANERHFVNFHRVLNRAPWSPRAAGRLLLRLLLRAFVPTGPLVFGLDDTLERRSGRRIWAKGVFHDSVRSRGATHSVNTPGLRWLGVMLLAPIPWARRVWALPVLTALAPNANSHAARGLRHKSLTDWARQLLYQLNRWCRVLAADRPCIVVADATFATLELLAALAPTWTCITRVRFDIALFTPAPPRLPGTRGAPRKKGDRLPSLVVSEVRLRDAEGTELVERIRGMFPRACLLILTGDPSPNAHSGVTRVFGKPWNREQLMSTARRLCLEAEAQEPASLRPFLP